MTGFRDFLEAKEANLWHASKAEIIDMWKNLKPVPIEMEPIPENQRGTRLQYDGIRLTGTAQFINSILARLKDILGSENNPGVRLDLEYRQVKTTDSQAKYLCYVHLEQDTKKKPGQPKLDAIQPFQAKKLKPLSPPELRI